MTNRKVFDTTFRKDIQTKFSNIAKWKWPAVARLICSPNTEHIQNVVEDIFKRFNIKSKKDIIRHRLRSEVNSDFLGAFYELITFDYFDSRGCVTETFIVNKKEPDYLIKYPRNAKCVLEVTSVTPYSEEEHVEYENIIELIAKIDEVMGTTDIRVLVDIPVYYIPLPRVNYATLQSNILQQYKKMNKSMTFTCTDGNIVIGISIIRKGLKTGGVEAFRYMPSDVQSEDKFQTRIYNQIRKKVKKYNDLKTLQYPFMIAIYIRGIFSEDTFQTALCGISQFRTIKRKKRVIFRRQESKILSGAILMNLIGSAGIFCGKPGQLDFYIEPEIYLHPDPLIKIDNIFTTIIGMGIDVEGHFLKQLECDDILYSTYNKTP